MVFALLQLGQIKQNVICRLTTQRAENKTIYCWVNYGPWPFYCAQNLHTCTCWERPIFCFCQCDDCTYKHISVGSMLLKHNSISPTQGTRAGCISHFWVEFFCSLDSFFIMSIHLGCSSAFRLSTLGVTVLVRYICSQPLEWTCIHNIAWCPMLSKNKSWNYFIF